MEYFYNVRKKEGRHEAYGKQIGTMDFCEDLKFTSLDSYSGSVQGQS